jgi:hypothetical protein
MIKELESMQEVDTSYLNHVFMRKKHGDKDSLTGYTSHI